MEDCRNMLVEEGIRNINFGEVGRRQWKFRRERKKKCVQKRHILRNTEMIHSLKPEGR